jgi:predicted lipid-binding transport protein (Tim44 family)
MGTIAWCAAGGLVAGALLDRLGHGLADRDVRLGFLDLLIGGLVVLVLMFVRRRRAARAPPPLAVPVASSVDTSPDRATTEADVDGGSSLDQGLRDIRRMDPGFDPTRFAGYTGMLFREAQAAWMTRDIGAVRDRLTPEMHAELRAQCDRLRIIGHADRVERIDITAGITEAWQESGRDYVTAHIGGSIVDYTVDAVTDGLIRGSRTIPREIEEFWTFTRAAGLNFWMLSAIQRA